MGFWKATKTCFAKYATFRGRAPRSEYWWFWVFLILLAIVAGILDYVLVGPQTLNEENGGPIAIITNLATFLPSLAVTVRRLHDVGKPWYYMLTPLAFILLGLLIGWGFGPFLGAIAGISIAVLAIAGFLLLFFWLVKPSDPYANQYGPGPEDPPEVEDVFA